MEIDEGGSLKKDRDCPESLVREDRVTSIQRAGTSHSLRDWGRRLCTGAEAYMAGWFLKQRCGKGQKGQWGQVTTEIY